ncbi:ABC transporter ATP-binding protein [Micromonospora endophytica]|uniref:ABC transporter ATP-binding protein n=1 Tax=Micromonospora endophytica TaxID=515350 RepID=A0A2W2DB70_9ACTN|nr:ABC transporter ATP-binding protein [Micromonospora endophytica]
MPLLDIRNLTVGYGEAAPSVQGVTLRVEPGEIVGLIGESGSGKSTVAMAALGLLPRSARIEAERFDVCGVDIRSASTRELNTLRGSSVAMVFQDAMGALDPCMRVGAQIAEVVKRHQRLRGAACRNEVLELMARVGLPNPETRARQYPHQLSGGLRQRAAIALALAGKPRILLADEPTTALDVTVQAGILRLFRRIRDELNVAIVLISHDMGVIAQTADRVAVMLDGSVVEQGSVEQVLLSPETPYTRKLLESAPSLDTEPARTEAGDAPVTGQHGSDPERRTDLMTVTGVTRRFRVKGRHITAVSDVSLSVKRGEVLGIVGESGSGKSTLAKLLVHLDKPSAGTLAMDGLDYTRLRGARARRFRDAVQMVFQHPAGSLNPRLKVGTSIREPMRASKVSRGDGEDRVRGLLREVGLPEGCGDRLPHEFSGGQKQRIAIARALSSSPDVVILDEPTSALDVSVQAQVLDLLDRLRSQHDLTYVFISHNLAVVRQVSDRVAVMYAGRVVEVGDCATIFANPQHWYTRTLIAAVPSTDPRHRNDGEGEAPRVGGSGAAGNATPPTDNAPACAFATRCPRAEARCWAEAPTLTEVGPGQQAACHFPAARGAVAEQGGS